MPGDRDETAAPLVSVLIPAYNHERFITRTLDSVAAETYPRVEIVVCDDGSADQTPVFVEDWIARHDSPPARLIRRSNQGVVATLNTLLEYARGDFVAPLASDDELVPGGLAARMSAMGGCTQAVFGDAIVIDDAGEVLADSALRRAGVDIKRLKREPAAELITRWRVPGPVLLVNTDALKKLDGWSDVLVEDWDMYLRLAARGWLSYVDVSVARYRIHASNSIKNRAARDRVLADHRRVARRTAREFGIRNRAALQLQRLAYTPLLFNSDSGRLRDIPWRIINRVVGDSARLIAGSQNGPAHRRNAR